ncbi:MAG TPA: hypothetical protein PKA13_10555 [Geminicoccaceae bacterium]|nr:hypothetical protein [Geminicoccus sp.]HMU50206.1 hypothetical protein [Geminicoccaceae bacterium]
MTPRHIAVAMTLILLAAAAVFHLSYLVVDLERQLAGLQREIEDEGWRLRTSRADLAYLTRPSRLARQAEQLGLKPANGQRIVDASAIGNRMHVELARNPLALTLPSGGEAVLMVRPMPGFGLIDAKGQR